MYIGWCTNSISEIKMQKKKKTKKRKDGTTHWKQMPHCWFLKLCIYYLLDIGDQQRNSHIDDTWVQQIYILNSENRIYLHNAHWKEDSINEANMQQTEADVDNSDDDYSEVDNSNSSAANRDKCWIAQLETYSLQYTYLLLEKAKFFCSLSPLHNTFPSLHFMWQRRTIK